MKQMLLQEKYPVFTLELDRDETTFRDVDGIIACLKEQVEAHPVARYIATFDHYAHTRALPEGRIAEDIKAAKNIVFCFGIALQDASVLSVRPRSIGVAETKRGFVVTFMEAPMPVANHAMEAWARALRNKAGDEAA